MSVFVSYSKDDEPHIKEVISELKSRGIVEENDKIIYGPDVIAPGSSFRAQIRQAIEAASKVVVVWSGTGAGSGQVNYETGMAEALGKPILIVVPKKGASTLPKELENIQIVELENVL
jgi:hypothetical protein